MKKRLLILTGGGDCPGLNAVIRAVVKRAAIDGGWEVYGSIEAYNGLLENPVNLRLLDEKAVAGIHFQGGTIIGTTNKGDPFHFPVMGADGKKTTEDRSEMVMQRLKEQKIDAVISIGGDGSQKIAQKFFEMGCPIVGVPKTIDNDLSATDSTFGFQTAVQIATEAVDKLVTTASSHSRVMILEVMGRNAGWIALYAAIAGGAEVCLIPEIPYDIEVIAERIRQRYREGRGFANIVVAEGAKPQGGDVVARDLGEVGYGHIKLGGISYQLAEALKHIEPHFDVRVTVLGHLQRGGIPTAYDRVLATRFGVKAFELVKAGKFGQMVSLAGREITDVSLKKATESYNHVDPDSDPVRVARGVGISFGDK
jgi:6-phosphofructokinase 1